MDAITNSLEQMPNVRKCFKELRFLSGMLTASMDGHPDGTCYQFYHLFQNPDIANRYQYMFLMEPDVRPIRPFWLDAVYEETLDRNDFWVKGSISQCSGPYAHLDFHINGNALYKLYDPIWMDYQQRVRSFYKPRDYIHSSGCSGGYGGFDHSLFHYSREGANWDYAQHMAYRLTYNTFVLNHCEHPYQPWEIVMNFPNTFLVHSKWANFKSAWDPRVHTYIEPAQLHAQLEAFMQHPSFRSVRYPKVFVSYLRQTFGQLPGEPQQTSVTRDDSEEPYVIAQ